MNKLFLSLAFCVLLADVDVFAQSGCTDPLASNYNAAATVNNGSCIYNSASVVPDTSFTLSTAIQETSGLIFWDHYVWTHNDNTDLNLYSLDTLSGAITQTYTLSGVVNNDWEEISQDDSYIYLGDFGNNANGNRTDLKILRIEKNSLLLNAPDIDTISFSYSNQTDFTPTGTCNTDFDCEAFIVSSDSIFLFTKQWIGKQTSVYSLPKTPGTYTAVLKTTYNISGLITGATYLQSKQLVVLCGYSNTLQPFTWLLYDFNGYNFFGGNKRKIAISLSLHQIEGVTTHDGLIYYYSNELFSRFKIITNEQKLHIVDLSLYLSNYINGSSATINENETENNGQIMIYPNPGKEIISVKLNNTNTTKNYFISDITGKIVLSGQLQNDSSNINVKKLKKGSYILKIGNNSVFKWVKE
ncbi:MAG TPA: T9SS type A sorting domain-containing protein [Bacteroidales bacterium]|nr:T9SS type A sorting domain-containing protein [Bacteroidales bacterium]